MIYNFSSFIINVDLRRNRKIACDKLLKRKKLESKFYIQPLHSNPIEGNKNSHISLIKKCKIEGLEAVLILEDDFKIIGNFKDLPELPEKWDILYLGGEVLRKLEPLKKGWVRCINKRHHAYIVNLKNDKLINEMEKCLDKKSRKYCDWMMERIQPQFRTYMINPMKFIQQEGISDITKKYEIYNNMENSFNSFFIPQHSIKNDLFNLKLPEMRKSELPNISLVTIVNNCRDIFSLSLKNYEDSFYPKKKIEWIILEDTEDDEKCIEDLLPKNNNIKYIRDKSKLDQGKMEHNQGKMEQALQHCSNDIIINMDVLGFYSREHILSRVKLLIKYPKLLGVGTNKLGMYDLIYKKSFSSTLANNLILSSLCFRKKSFDRPFKENIFFKDRLDQFINIPHTFIQYGIIFEKEKKNNLSQQLFNFYDTWDIIDQEFMDNLGKYVIKKYRFNEINNPEILI